jgi:hypothetical protein
VVHRSVRRFRGESHDESGVALIVAITVVMLLTLVTLTVFTQAIQQLPLSRRDQDHEAALHAAESGIDNYLSRLAQNANYWASTDTSNLAFTSWVKVAGPANNNEYYTYSVDTSKAITTGVVYLTSSGKSRNAFRTVRVGLRREGFLDYLWFTDYERLDPTLRAETNTSCYLRGWEQRSGNNYGPDLATGCNGLVYWTDSASINGPVHSNDSYHVSGNPQFSQPPDSYFNSGPSGGSSGATKFAGPAKVLSSSTWGVNAPAGMQGGPVSGNFLQFPATAASVKAQADKSAAGSPTGCLYTGPTTITLKVVGGVAKMNVDTKTPTTPGNTKLNANCLGATATTDLPLPANGVIFVQNNPTSGPDRITSGCASPCDGDVSVKGTLKGQLTIASENDVNIIGNVTYNTYPGGTDVLGLVALNNVAVCHLTTPCATPTKIEAAILALAHSFYVQSWDTGGVIGTLTVNGVIAQKYRGAVGTFSGTSTTNGYDKDYNYDSRLKYLSPPFFLTPLQSAWQKISYAETKVDGTQRSRPIAP